MRIINNNGELVRVNVDEADSTLIMNKLINISIQLKKGTFLHSHSLVSALAFEGIDKSRLAALMLINPAIRDTINGLISQYATRLSLGIINTKKNDPRAVYARFNIDIADKSADDYILANNLIAEMEGARKASILRVYIKQLIHMIYNSKRLNDYSPSLTGEKSDNVDEDENNDTTVKNILSMYTVVSTGVTGSSDIDKIYKDTINLYDQLATSEEQIKFEGRSIPMKRVYYFPHLLFNKDILTGFTSELVKMCENLDNFDLIMQENSTSNIGTMYHIATGILSITREWELQFSKVSKAKAIKNEIKQKESQIIEALNNDEQEIADNLSSEKTNLVNTLASMNANNKNEIMIHGHIFNISDSLKTINNELTLFNYLCYCDFYDYISEVSSYWDLMSQKDLPRSMAKAIKLLSDRNVKGDSRSESVMNFEKDLKQQETQSFVMTAIKNNVIYTQDMYRYDNPFPFHTGATVIAGAAKTGKNLLMLTLINSMLGKSYRTSKDQKDNLPKFTIDDFLIITIRERADLANKPNLCKVVDIAPDFEVLSDIVSKTSAKVIFINSISSMLRKVDGGSALKGGFEPTKYNIILELLTELGQINDKVIIPIVRLDDDTEAYANAALKALDGNTWGTFMWVGRDLTIISRSTVIGAEQVKITEASTMIKENQGNVLGRFYINSNKEDLNIFSSNY